MQVWIAHNRELAPHAARILWKAGYKCELSSDGTIWAQTFIADSAKLMELTGMNWRGSEDDKLSANLFTPVGDSAYYNGLLMGYFGRITTADGEALIMTNNRLGRVVSDRWEWDIHNKRWWVDLYTHKPLIVPA